MFENIDAARALFAQHYDAATTARIVAALTPCIGFEPIKTKSPPLGATRFGGEPDISSALDWPRRLVPDDLDTVVRNAGPGSVERLRYQLGQALPYAFIGQIDLAEAAALGDVAAVLPNNGRLLFFYDTAAGAWCLPGSCRVILDQAPQGSLKRAERPAIFAEMEAKAREFDDADFAVTQQSAAQFDYDGMRKGMRNAGVDAEEIERQVAAIRDVMRPEVMAQHRGEFASPYTAPAQPMRLTSGLAIVHGFSVEAQLDPKLVQIAELLSEKQPLEAWNGDNDDPKHQLLGPPVPVQDDPRAEVVARGDKEWPEVLRMCADWRLLLQVSLADYAPKSRSEGTVYFLIPRTDLAARNFDNVVAVYQQT